MRGYKKERKNVLLREILQPLATNSAV